jgi:hypothetical protein
MHSFFAGMFSTLQIIFYAVAGNDFINARIPTNRVGIVAIMPSKQRYSAIDKSAFQVYKQAHILVSRGVCTNTGYCPKMSKDANG